MHVFKYKMRRIKDFRLTTSWSIETSICYIYEEQKCRFPWAYVVAVQFLKSYRNCSNRRKWRSKDWRRVRERTIARNKEEEDEAWNEKGEKEEELPIVTLESKEKEKILIDEESQVEEQEDVDVTMKEAISS